METRGLVSFWYVAFLLGSVAVFGNAVTLAVIKHSKRVRRLINFYLCVLAANNLVVATSLLLSLVAYTLQSLAAKDDQDDLARLARTLHATRDIFWWGASGSQLWVLTVILMAPKMVMTTTVKSNAKSAALVLPVAGLPYLISFAAEAPALLVSEEAVTCLQLVMAGAFWGIHLLVLAITCACKKMVNEPPSSASTRYVRTPTPRLFRRSRRSHRFPQIPNLRTFRQHHRAWTTETCHVIAVSNVSLSIMWAPFYAQQVCHSLRAVPELDDVTSAVTSLNCLVYCALNPLLLFAFSANFRQGCLAIFAKRFRGKQKKRATGATAHSHHQRHPCTFITPSNNGRLLPREPTTARSLSEDVTISRQITFASAGVRSLSLDIVANSSTGSNLSSLHWKRPAWPARYIRKVYPEPFTLEQVEMSCFPQTIQEQHLTEEQTIATSSRPALAKLVSSLSSVQFGFQRECNYAEQSDRVGGSNPGPRQEITMRKSVQFELPSISSSPEV